MEWAGGRMRTMVLSFVWHPLLRDVQHYRVCNGPAAKNLDRYCKLTLVSDRCTNGSIDNSIEYWFGSVMREPCEGQFLLSVGRHGASLLSH